MGKHRHGLVGGTAIAKIVKESKWGGPFAAFLDMQGHDSPATPPMKRGLRLEGACRTTYVEDYGAQLVAPHPGVIVNPKYPFAAASVDDLAKRDGVDLVVDYKTVGYYGHADWGDDLNDIYSVPVDYRLQAQWYMGITGRPAADIAAMFDLDTFRVYRLPADPALQEFLFAAGEKFYRDHVLTGIPPPPDSSEECEKYLHKKYPRAVKPLIEADATAEHWAKVLKASREAKKVAVEQEDLASNALKAIIGDARGVVCSLGTLTCIESKGNPKMDWEGLRAEVGVSAETWESLKEKHSTRSPYRSIRFTKG